VDFTPTYANEGKGCQALGVAATVKMEGCVYRVALVEGGTSPFPTTTAIVCPAGKSIIVTASSLPCTVTIWEQSGLSGVSLENGAGPEPRTSRQP